ncbi:uncharacterized protein LOC119113872 [Pollicipes pollicipes]|uniref:uncharacterized protein LOC119113817 n=1 Tax=Pollicipes pollicipes TaxID=41117 RepID=UPI00188529F6|nr:uncharacterized protein LOC119113817 [Pollicipes pollicipes]XP_037094000.1 uncharacterized protein LOC119113872 [Pollicipes pollicipes]
MLATLLVLLVALCASGAAERLPTCHSCLTSAAGSACHMRPVRKPEMTSSCSSRTDHCVTDRLQDADGSLVSIERRCSTREETKMAHNRCEETDDGYLRCFTFCYGDFCNRGTGRLYQSTRFWHYDEPQYSDYVYDPEEAVLDRRRKLSTSGAFAARPELAGALVGNGGAGRAGGAASGLVCTLSGVAVALLWAWRRA